MREMKYFYSEKKGWKRCLVGHICKFKGREVMKRSKWPRETRVLTASNFSDVDKKLAVAFDVVSF